MDWLSGYPFVLVRIGCAVCQMLTKLNWNSSDSISRLPIIILFARRVGELMCELSDDAIQKPSYRFRSDTTSELLLMRRFAKDCLAICRFAAIIILLVGLKALWFYLAHRIHRGLSPFWSCAASH